MAEQTEPEVSIPSAHVVLVPADDKVVIDGVAPALMRVAVQFAYLHWLLFGLPLVITSGKDGQHAPGSLHPEGRALDFRTHDKTDDEMIVFLAILTYAAPAHSLRVFDERVGPGGEHIHVEYHG